ncbi:winged helix-turn-helix domain-containing protein [Actinokineospora pegani]|uniref:winged helix-turn-helix domain-containing protein n=1 Tax=Actinokineospora pegani TaxID=2654637 RepID=UPI0012EAE26B|nr:winged helix-turn-helix domain-containing protein [Actinokineospora pegani]
MPDLVEIQTTLRDPMTSGVVIDLLTCAGWVTWALIVTELVRCLSDVVRHAVVIDRQRTGPIHRIMAAFVGAFVISLLGQRVGGATPAATTQAATAPPVRPPDTPLAVVRPPDPVTGAHDSLWRIAARTLGDGKRWTEVFELNRDKPQPHGTLTRPDLIFPGQTFALPVDAPIVEPLAPPPRAPTIQPPVDLPSAVTPVPQPPLSNDSPAVAPSAGVLDWAPELVGVGLVAAASAGMVLARRQRNRREHHPPAGALRVYALLRIDPPAEQSPPAPRIDGVDTALALAAGHGLGLIGDGTASAVHTLLAALLTRSSPAARIHARVLVTATAAPVFDLDVARLNIQVVTDLDAALQLVAAELRSRTDEVEPSTGWPPLLLVAKTPGAGDTRLRELLQRGSPLGLTVVVIGHWPGGVTAYVGNDGAVSTTTPGEGEPLRGTSLVRSDVDLEDLLRASPEPEVHAEEPPVETGTNRAAKAGLRITLLGHLRVWWRHDQGEQEITSTLQPRARELLLFLALHPEGASREALIAALWPTSPPERTTNALNTGVSRLRRALTLAVGDSLANAVLTGDGRFQLDPDLVEVDYHRFAAAVASRRAAMSDQERAHAYRDIVNAYTGPLADGMSTEWIETAREAARRDAVDAVAALARALVDHDPQQTLDLLEIARSFDPHNEFVYRDIIRLQDRVGQADAIPRTLALLKASLAEIGDSPSPESLALVAQLRRRRDAANQLKSQ